MSTRATIWMSHRLHLYYDVVNRGLWLGVGSDSYPRIVLPLTPWRSVRWHAKGWWR